MKKVLISIIVVQTIVLLTLIIFTLQTQTSTSDPIQNASALPYQYLSSRITTGTLPPKSDLILQYDSLKKEMEIEIQKQNGTVSIELTNLGTSASLSINPKEQYFPASLNKLPIAIAILKKVEREQLNYTTPILINQESKDMTRGIGLANITSVPLQTMLQLDLQFSDNTAHTSLLKYVTTEDVNTILDSSDYFQIYDNPEHISQLDPEITTKSMYPIFTSLFFSTSLDPANSELLLSFLTNTTFQIKTFTTNAKNITIAQKYGSAPYQNHQYFHSCGIMYLPKNPTFFCILTKDMTPNQAATLIGKIVDMTHTYTMNQTDFQRIQSSQTAMNVQTLPITFSKN